MGEANACPALRLIRTFHHLSQKEGAERLGISKSYLSEIESGRKIPTLQLIEAYAKVYELPVSSILFFSENMDGRASYGNARRFVAKKVIKLLRWIENGADHRAS
jgi:transcriptional regulator with XRE-family HTH domain